MPERTRTRVARTGGGFGGFAPNPTFDRNLSPEAFGDWTPQASEIHPPVLTSLPPSTPPRSTPAYNAPPRSSPPPVVIDPSGAGFVNSRLFENGIFGTPGPSRQSQTWMNPNEEELWASGGVNGPASGSAEAIPTIASSGGRPPPFISDPNDDWMGRSGEPNVEVAREDAQPRGMADEPVLFEDPTRGNNNPSLAIDPAINSRPPTNPGYMANFAGNMTIGQFLSTPLAFLRFGEGRGVGSGNVDLSQAGREAYLNEPVSGGARADISGAEGTALAEVSAEAEARGAQETAELRARGELPPANAERDPRGDRNMDATMKAFLLGGGYVGVPNSPGYAISEGSYGQFDPRQGTARLDESGGISFIRRAGNAQKPMDMSWMKNAPALYGSTAEKRSAWMRQQPQYIAWMKSRGG